MKGFSKGRSLRFLVFTIYLVWFSIGRAEVCSELFTGDRTNEGGKEVLPGSHESEKVLISYLSFLLERNRLTPAALQTMIEELSRETWDPGRANPIPETLALIESSAWIARRRLEHLLKSLDGRQEGVIAWLKSRLGAEAARHESREGARRETADPFESMVFHSLPKGRFSYVKRGQDGNKFIGEWRINHHFKLMANKVTQKQWVDLMGENPAHFSDGPDAVTIPVGGRYVTMQPNHPVENVSFWSMLVFANRLSERERREPAYDFSDVSFTGRAEDGTLQASLLSFKRLKIRAPGNDLYRAKGYRLATQFEMIYVLTNLGADKELHARPEDAQERERRIWHRGNSDQRSQAVASREPWVRNGHSFYDLLGNGRESFHHWHDEEHAAYEPRNGHVAWTLFSPVLLYGSFTDTFIDGMQIDRWDRLATVDPMNDVTFRLALSEDD